MPTLLAPAKLTLSLRVTGTRSDGFHTIDAEMVSLDFGDRLDIDPDGTGLTVVTPGSEKPGEQEDLVLRAMQLAGRRAGVRLHKVIPMGAGLGGGSADAAAILRWAGWSDEARAAELGADVPFCLHGGRARVRGIGELVEPLQFQEMTLTLFTPPVYCSTPEVYRRWDEMGGPRGEYGNDLEPAALSLVPSLAVHREDFASSTGEWPRLAGSGSTWWVHGEHPGPGHVVTRAIPPML